LSRGKKLDLFVGAQIEDEWAVVESSSKKESSKILMPKEHKLHFQKEKRRAKTVTLVGEFFLEKEQSNTLVKKFKKQLGCGGSFKNGFMEFQGEVQQKLRELLEKEGFKFKN